MRRCQLLQFDTGCSIDPGLLSADFGGVASGAFGQRLAAGDTSGPVVVGGKRSLHVAAGAVNQLSQVTRTQLDVEAGVVEF